jgi:hypothetical protein
MAASSTSDVDDRIARLEQQVKELYARVVALERLVGSGGLHDYDQATVRRKVEYDWQS